LKFTLSQQTYNFNENKP